MQANCNENYLAKVGYFSYVNAGWKWSRSGETCHLGEMSQLI